MTELAVYAALFVSVFLVATVLPVLSEAVLAGLFATARSDPALLLVVAMGVIGVPLILHALYRHPLVLALNSRHGEAGGSGNSA